VTSRFLFVHIYIIGGFVKLLKSYFFGLLYICLLVCLMPSKSLAIASCDILNKYIDNRTADPENFCRNVFNKELTDITKTDINEYSNLVILCAKKSGKQFYSRVNVKMIEEYVDKYFVDPFTEDVDSAKKKQSDNLKMIAEKEAFMKDDLEKIASKAKNENLTEQEYARLSDYASDNKTQEILSIDNSRLKANLVKTKYDERIRKHKEETEIAEKTEKLKKQQLQQAMVIKYSKFKIPQTVLTKPLQLILGQGRANYGTFVEFIDKLTKLNGFDKCGTSKEIIYCTMNTKDPNSNKKWSVKYEFVTTQQADHVLLYNMIVNNKPIQPNAIFQFVGTYVK